MNMSIWVIISWVTVAILIAINIFIFLKLKKASDQMMKMAFPNAKNMNDALAQMQGMMGGMKKGKGKNKGRMGGSRNPQMDSQLKNAMDLLSRMNNK